LVELSRNLDEADYQDTDSDGVRELPDGSPMDVKIALQSGNETYQRIAEILTNHLAEVGIRVSVDEETISKSDYTNQLRNDGVYEIYIGQTTTGCAQWTGVVNYVADIIGYRPDGYMLITLDAFVDIVDLMGGVEFDVPMDMFYEDSSQDLFIDLKEGKQTLDGYAAMGLVRFRKGYYDQDLGRVDVQRQFLSACMDQWLTLPNLVKLPQILSTMHASSESSLTTGNLLWIAYTAWRSGLGNLQTETLPGYADMLDGVSYYILDPEGVADVINRCCNPYTREIDASDLNIVY